MADERVPVEAGQWRKGALGFVYAVLRPHPRRRGHWICIGSEFPHGVVTCGRRELEAMPLVERDYFGAGRPHPGEQFARAVEGAEEVTDG